MARKPTDKQLFKMKNEWLGQFYEEVKPKDFYRAVFPEGSFEREGHPEDEKCNGVLTVIEGEKGARGQGGTIRQWKRKEKHVRIVSTTKSGFALSWEIM